MPRGGNEGQRSKRVEDIEMKTDEVLLPKTQKTERHTFKKIQTVVISVYTRYFFNFNFKVLCIFCNARLNFHEAITILMFLTIPQNTVCSICKINMY